MLLNIFFYKFSVVKFLPADHRSCSIQTWLIWSSPSQSPRNTTHKSPSCFQNEVRIYTAELLMMLGKREK